MADIGTNGNSSTTVRLNKWEGEEIADHHGMDGAGGNINEADESKYDPQNYTSAMEEENDGGHYPGGGGGGNKQPKIRNEESFSRKIFVGGIGWDTSDEDLKSYFGQFGEVAHAQVKYDYFTGRSRGFAFIEFANSDACREALKEKDREIKGKKCEVKPAKSRENKKIFIGGLPADYPEQELRTHFEQYGRVDEIEWPFDKFQSKRKNFAFVVFEDEEAAARAAANSKQRFGERSCDVKIAVPQYMRPQKQPGAAGAGVGGGGGGGGWSAYHGTGGLVSGAAAAAAAAGWGDYANSYSGYGGYSGGGYNYYDDRYASYDYGGYAVPSAGDYANWQGYDNWAGTYGGTGTPAIQTAGGGAGTGGLTGHRTGNRASGGGGAGGAGGATSSYGNYY